MGEEVGVCAPAALEGEKPDRSRKRAKGAPSHVVRWPVGLRPGQQRLLDARFLGLTRVYNAVLGEAIKRSKAVKADAAWQAAREMPRRTMKEAQARRQAFEKVEATHGFSKTAVGEFATGLRRSHIRRHVLAHEFQVVAGRAWGAASDWHYGKRGKPKFKSAYKPSRTVRSASGKDSHSAIQPHHDQNGILDGLRWGPRQGGLVLPLVAARSGAGRRAREEQQAWMKLQQSVASGLLYARLVRTRRGVRDGGRWAYEAQFVVDGKPSTRHPIADSERACVDFGPSMAAIARTITDTDDNETWTAGTVEVAEGVENIDRELRRWQRKLDRQHRAGSPDCFNADGTHKRKCVWTRRSRQARVTQARITELHRRAAAHRDTRHGELANGLLAVANDIRVEKISYLAWAKAYPHSTRRHSVGGQVKRIERNAKSGGASFHEISTYDTALSQTCLCGHKERKPLRVRQHNCPECGLQEHRDVLSAFEGLHVEQILNRTSGEIRDTLDLESANSLYPMRAEAGSVLPRHDAAEDRGHSARKNKRRGRRPPSRRSVARIQARRLARQSRSVKKSGQTAPTADPRRIKGGDSA